MIEFEVSAPGKITLFGEHAQLFKEKATVVAGSIDLRTTLKFAELPDSLGSQNVIKIEFPHVDLSVDIPLQQVLSHFRGDDESDSSQLCTKVEKFVLLELRIRLSEIQVKNLKVLLYLLFSIAQHEQIDIKSFHVHVNTLLPTCNENLGITMSSAVCLAACFLHWSRLQKDIRDTEFDKDHLAKISKYATECEDFIYTDYVMPGLDGSACTYGLIIEFHPEKPVDVFLGKPSMKVLLIDTKDTDTISTEMANIYKLKEEYPAVVDSIATSIETVSKSACEALHNFCCDDTDESEYEKCLWVLYNNLALFMTINQKLIRTLGVSNKALDTISNIGRKYLLSLKYTNGGRYAYILLPPNIKDQLIEDFSKDLLGLRFTVTMVHLGCDGVRIE